MSLNREANCRRTGRTLSADTSDQSQKRQSDHCRPRLHVKPLRYSSSESGRVIVDCEVVRPNFKEIISVFRHNVTLLIEFGPSWHPHQRLTLQNCRLGCFYPPKGGYTRRAKSRCVGMTDRCLFIPFPSWSPTNSGKIPPSSSIYLFFIVLSHEGPYGSCVSLGKMRGWDAGRAYVYVSSCVYPPLGG